MLNNSPWLWHATQTAANMTGRNSLGIDILQGKRKKGITNESIQVLQSQAAAALIWPMFRKAPGFIRDQFTAPRAPGISAANQFYQFLYDNAINFDGMGGAALNLDDVIFAKGLMTPTNILTATGSVATHSIVFTWPTALSDSSQESTDVGWYVVYNATQDKTGSASVVARSAGTSGTIVLPTGFMALTDDVRIYVNFAGAVGASNEGTSSTSKVEAVIISA